MFDNPMFSKMLGAALENSPQMAIVVQKVDEVSRYVYDGMQRIERKMDLILDDLNDQRNTSGLAPIEFTRTPERGGSGS